MLWRTIVNYFDQTVFMKLRNSVKTERLEKMTSRVSVNEMARSFAINYRKNNPQASQLTVQAETRNYIQDLAKTQKISKKEIAKVQAVVSEVFSQNADVAKANSTILVSPKTEKLLTQTNSQQAERHYQAYQNMTKAGRKRLHERNLSDAKSAFLSDEYTRFLEEKHPELIEKPKEEISNNQYKKQANAEYKSSKKQKNEKKLFEQKSALEHKKQRPNKSVRNAEYTTSIGKMTQKAKKAFNDTVAKLKNSEKSLMSIQEFIDKTQVPVNPTKSAEDSMKVFIENGIVKAEPEVQNTATNVLKSSEKLAKGSHNKVLIGLAAVGTALAAIFGYSASSKKSEEIQEAA